MAKKIPVLKHKKLNDGFIELHYSDDLFHEKYIYTDEWLSRVNNRWEYGCICK